VKKHHDPQRFPIWARWTNCFLVCGSLPALVGIAALGKEVGWPISCTVTIAVGHALSLAFNKRGLSETLRTDLFRKFFDKKDD